MRMYGTLDVGMGGWMDVVNGESGQNRRQTAQLWLIGRCTFPETADAGIVGPLI